MIMMSIVTLTSYGFELYLLTKALQALGSVTKESVQCIKYDSVTILNKINSHVS